MRPGQRNELRRKLLSAAVAACFAGELVYANPVGPAVVNGQGSFATQGTTLSVTNTPGAIINWQQFSIQANEATRFIQQSAASAVLNRVVGVDPSRILGTLQSNGRVFLINPNGILFGAGAQIDVAGLVASTLKLSNEDFIAGRMNFVGDAGQAAVINQGNITAAPGGRVYLIGQAVENQGVINAPNGDIVLAAGHSVRVTEGTSPGVQVEIVAPADRTLNVTELVYSPRGIYAGLVRNSGVIRADSVVRGADGSITLKASQELALEPGSQISANGLDGGRIVMEAPQAGIGGSVQALGSAGAIELSAREITVQGELHSAGELTLSTENLTVVNGGVRAATGAMAISGNFVQTGGSVVPGASVISVGGNWMRAGGIFDAGTSTVMFKDATKPSAISGDNTFYNFTSVTPAKQLRFEAGATQTVLGALTLQGEKFKLIDLRSTDPDGVQWRLDARGPVDVQFVHLGDAWNIRPTLIKALPSNSYGNNTGWDTDPVWSALAVGNWSTPGNWDTGVIPGAADTVTFNATSVQNSTVDAGFAGTINNLNINAGYTGTINLARSLTINSAFSQAAGNFTAGGNALTINNGNFTLSGGAFTAPSSTLSFNATGAARTFTISGGTFNHNNGTVQFGNLVNFGITVDVPANQPFNNVTVAHINNSSLNPFAVANGKTLTVDGTLTLTNGLLGSNTGIIDANGVIVVGAGFDGTVSSQGTLLLIDGAGDQSFVVPSGAILPRMTLNSANTTISFAPGATASLSGDFTLQAGTFTSTSGTLTVASIFSPQNLTISGGTFNHNNGTVQFGNGLNTSFGITADVPANQAFNNVTVNMFNGVGFPLSVAAGKTLTVDGTLTLTNGALGSTTGTIDANGAIVVGAGFGGADSPQGTLLLINGAGDQSFVVPSGAKLPRMTLNSANTTVSFAPGATASLSGDITLQAGTFTSTSGTLTVASLVNPQNFTISGGTFNHNNGTVQYGNGATNFGITVDVPANQPFNNVTANMLNGGGFPLTIAGGTTLTALGTFTHTDGVINTGTIAAQGAVTIGAGADGGTGILQFIGTANQTYTQTGNAMDGLVTVNKASGTVTLASATTWNAAGQNLTVTSGTLGTGGFSLSTGALTLASSGSLLQGTGAITATNLSNAGTFSGGSAPITLSGNMTLSGGTFTSTSGTLTVPGGWTHTAGGTFSHNNGTVLANANLATWDVAGTETFNNLTVNKISGQTLTIGAGDSLIAQGTFIHTDGVINTGTIQAEGTVAVGVGADGGTALLSFTGTGNQTYTQTGNAIDGLVTINKASGTVTLASPATWNAAAQNLTVTSGNLDSAGFALSTGALTVASAGTVLQGSGAITATSLSNAGTFSGGSASITLSGNMTLTGGTFTSTSGTLSVGGNWTHTAGGTFNHNNGTVAANVGNSIWDVAGTETFNNLTVNKTGFNFIMGAGDTLITQGTFTHTDGVINTGTIQAEGTVLVGAAADGGSALLSFTGTANQTYTQTGNAIDGLVTINKASGTVTLASATAWNAAGQNLTVTSGALDMNGIALSTGTLTLESAGTVLQGSGSIAATNLSNAGTFSGGSSAITLSGNLTLTGGTFTSTSGTLSVAGNWTHTAGGTFNHNNGTVVANVNSAIWDVTGTETFNNLTVNKTGGFNFIMGAGDTLITQGTFLHTDGVINTGTIQAQGTVAVGAAADGGTALLSFTGTGNQTYTQTGNAIDGLVTINKASGTVTLASAATWNAAGQNLTVTSGTLDLAGFALSTGALTVASAGTVLQGSGAITATNLSNAGIFSGGSAPITLSGDMTLSGGTFTSTTANLTVNGAWTHTVGGTFLHNSGSVVAAGGDSTWNVAVTENFNNLTVNKGNTNNMIITAGDTLIVGGTFTHTDAAINGGTVEARGPVTIGSLTDGGSATLRITSTGAQTIQGNGGSTMGLRVSKPTGTLSLGTTGISIGSLTIDAGNTLISTSGTLTVRGAWTNTAGGVFDHNNGTVVASRASSTWNVAVTESFNNLTVNLDDTNNLTFSGFGDTLIVGGTFIHNDGGINGGNIAAQRNVTIGVGSDGGSARLQFTGGNSQLYTDNGGQKTTGTVTVNKTVGSVVTLATDMFYNSTGQNLTITSGTLDLAGRNLTVRNVFTIGAAGTLRLQGAEAISKTPVIAADGTVTYNGTAPAFTLKNYSYSNLTIDGGAATVFSFPANLTTINTLTLNNSITSLEGSNLTATTLANNAILRMQGNETVTITNMDTNSGLVQYVGDGAGGLNSFSIKEFGAVDYFNLSISGVSGSETFSVATPLKLNGALTHTTGALNLAANLTTAAGAITSNDVVNLTSNVLIDTTDAGALPGGAPMSFVGVMTASGTASFATGANALTLTNAGNDFQGAVSLFNSGANNVAITDTNVLILGTLSIGNNLAVSAGGSISQTGVLTVPGTSTLTLTAANSDVLLDTAANNLGGVVSFAGTLANLRDVGLRNVNAGATVPSLAGLTNLRDLTLQFDNAAISLPTLTLAAGGDLAVTAGGAITQTAPVIVPGTTTLSANANAMTLTNAGNDFQGAVSLSNSGANNVAITDTNALILGASSIGNNLTVTAGGSISQTGTLTVPGTSTLTLTAAGSDVLLDTSANDLTGVVSFAGTLANIRDVGLRNVNAGATAPSLAGLTNLRDLTLQFDNAAVSLPALTLTAGGDLAVTAGGAITQTGAVSVPGTTTLSANANALTLTNVGNDFQGAVSLNNAGANDVALTDTNALILGASNVGGTLTVAAGAGGAGALTQSGTLTASALTATAAGGIAFTTFANDVGTVSLTNSASGNVAYLSNRAAGVTLTGSNTTGSLSATEQGGGGLIVGAGGINTGAGDVVLAAPGGALTVSGAITSVSGNVTLSSGGDVVISNNVAAAGNLQFTSSGNIDINPAVPITVSGNDVTLTGASLNLGNPAAVASLTLSAADSLTLNATNAVNIQGGAAPGAFARVEATGIIINADTLLFAGGAGAGAYGAAVANAGNVMLNGATSITFTAGTGANADGVLSAPLWNVVVTTPSCVGCNLLSVDPFTNPPSEAGIHALTVSGLTPAPPPIIVVPVDPVPPPVIADSALVVPQPAAEQQIGIEDLWEGSLECRDTSGYASATFSAVRKKALSACPGVDAGLVEIKPPGGV